MFRDGRGPDIASVSNCIDVAVGVDISAAPKEFKHIAVD